MKPNTNQSGYHQQNDGSYPMMGTEYMATTGQQYFPQQQHQQIQFQQYPSAGPPMMFPPGMQQTHGMPTGPSYQQQSPPPSQYHFQQQTSGQQGPSPPSYGAGQYFIDAACTVPAGQLSQQPQLLHQMPAGGQPFPGVTGTTRACSNPDCKHCGINGGGKPHSRR